MTSTTAKPRRLDQIARAIVRDLRSQDAIEGDTERTAEDQVQGWLDSANQGGDRLTACAILYLGVGEAARVYARGRGSSRVTGPECDRLVARMRKA